MLNTDVNLVRLERETQNRLRSNGERIAVSISEAEVFTEDWSDTSAWSGTGVVSGGKVYSSGGLTRSAPSSDRFVYRMIMTSTGLPGKFSYIGVGSSPAAADLIGIGQGSASNKAAILVGANISGSDVVIPRTLPNLSAGDYLCTIAVDETHISLTLQGIPSGQYVFGARIAIADMPGPITTLFLSANDNVTGQRWGSGIVYGELAVPPVADRVVNGVNLFGPGQNLIMFREDPNTGIGHMISVPGDLDCRVANPVVLFAHQASTGTAMSPFAESRMSNVVDAFTNAGYILLSSDNGPGTTGGGTQDKFANQESLDDYAAALDWARSHFNTGAVMLLGPSQGSFVSQNLLKQRKVGGIAAVATISGGSNLMVMESDPTYQAGLWAAYGASSTAEFTVNAAEYNPLDQEGYEFRGVPQRFYVASDDTTAPPEEQIDPFILLINDYVPECVKITLTGGHLADALYQGTDLVAFYDRYK